MRVRVVGVVVDRCRVLCVVLVGVGLGGLRCLEYRVYLGIGRA